MSTLTKVFVVMNTLVTIALSVLFIAGSAQWQTNKNLLDTYQAQRDAAVAERASLTAGFQASLAIKDEEISRIERQRTDGEARIAALTAELTSVKAGLASTESKLQGAEASRTSLEQMLNVSQGELNSVRARYQAVLNQNQDLQTRNERLNNRTLELTTSVSILTDQIRNMQEKLYACERGSASQERISVSAPTQAALTSAAPANVTPTRPTVATEIHGSVVTVSDRYAEISVGEANGVHSGMVFLVYRGGGSHPQYVGELIVETVEAHKAGGRIVSGSAGAFRRGDLVAYGID